MVERRRLGMSVRECPNRIRVGVRGVPQPGEILRLSLADRQEEERRDRLRQRALRVLRMPTIS